MRFAYSNLAFVKFVSSLVHFVNCKIMEAFPVVLTAFFRASLFFKICALLAGFAQAHT